MTAKADKGAPEIRDAPRNEPLVTRQGRITEDAREAVRGDVNLLRAEIATLKKTLSVRLDDLLSEGETDPALDLNDAHRLEVLSQFGGDIRELSDHCETLLKKLREANASLGD